MHKTKKDVYCAFVFPPTPGAAASAKSAIGFFLDFLDLDKDCDTS